jgi:flagellar motility protein MotE (MotC chaperone)
MTRLILPLAAVFLAMLALACGKKEEPPQVKQPVTAKEVQQKANEALSTIKDFTDQRKKEYQQQVAGQLAAMQKKLDEMKGQLDKASPELRARLEKEMLESKRDLENLLKSLAALETATGKAWEEMKGGVSQALENLQKSQEKPAKESR